MCLAVPGQLLSIEGDDPLLKTGKVSFGGVVKSVSLAYVPEAEIGDYVIVHVGFAISRLDEEEAQKTLEYLAEIGEIQEAMQQMEPMGPTEPLEPMQGLRPTEGTEGMEGTEGTEPTKPIGTRDGPLEGAGAETASGAGP